MLPALLPSLIARLTRRRPRPARALEPADMGTAFGMEQWLDERDGGAHPAVSATARRRTWLPRWMRATTLRRTRTHTRTRT